MSCYRTERHVVNEGTVEFRELNGRGLLCRNLRNVVNMSHIKKDDIEN